MISVQLMKFDWGDHFFSMKGHVIRLFNERPLSPKNLQNGYIAVLLNGE